MMRENMGIKNKEGRGERSARNRKVRAVKETRSTAVACMIAVPK
jgi:hypothetical protein